MPYSTRSIENLKQRFMLWTIDEVRFLKGFPLTPEHKAVRNQLVRSATSAAANFRPACRSKSLKDMINKLKYVEEELDESMFWLEFSMQLAKGYNAKLLPLQKEANELVSITVKSITTLRLINQKS